MSAAPQRSEAECSEIEYQQSVGRRCDEKMLDLQRQVCQAEKFVEQTKHLIECIREAREKCREKLSKLGVVGWN
jgi:hypothetical protein